MAEKWVGKVAVVTGASAGIGAAIVKDFAKLGINVVGLARRPEKVESLIKELGTTKGKAYARQCDVSNPESVTDAFKWIESKFKVVNILVNNAGVARNVNFFDENPETLKKLNEVIDTNVKGLAHCTREGYRLMNKSGDYGLIVNVNSVVGHNVPVSGFSMNIYPASKFAVTALTESLRQELIYADNKKIRVTSLSPGFVNTEMPAASGFVDPNGKVPAAIAEMPSLHADDISNAVSFLLSTPYNVNITELTIRPVGEKM